MMIKKYPPTTRGRTATAALLAAMLAASQSTHAATENWTGATNGIWGTNTNWSGSVTPDSTYDLTIAGPGDVAGTALNINIAAAAAANSLAFTNTAATTLTGTTALQTLTLSSSATAISTGTGAVTIGGGTGVNVSLGASQTWDVGSGGLTVTNVVSGSGFGITKTGTGTLTLSSNNTFNGGLTINAGTVSSTAAQGFGNGGSTVSIGASGTANVTLGSDQNVNNVFTGTGSLTVSGSTGAVNFNNASALNGFTGTLNVNTSGGKKLTLNTAGGNIGSGATVNVASGGTLYIANNSTYSGVTFNLAGAGNTENLGALRLESGATIGATSSIVLSGNTQLGGNSASTINAVISETGGARSVEKLGSGTMTFAGNNTYTGATILTAGTLSVSTDSAGAYNLGGGGTNGITFNGGTLQITGTAMTNFGSHTLNLVATKNVNLDIANIANNFTVSQALDSTMTTGQVVKTGAGTLTLSGANTYTGGTRANAGTLVLSGSHTKAAGTTDFLSVNNVGAQNAVLKVTAGTHGFTDFNIGEIANSRGAVYQSSGDMSIGSTGGGIGVKVGSGATSYGYYKLSGGTLTNANVDFQVGGGSGATGVMDVTGGSVTTGAWIVLGRNGAGNGLLNVTGGSVTSNSQNIGLNWANTAGSISILNVGGGSGAASVTGASSATNYFDVSQSNTTGTTGVANLLTNGTLTVGRVQSSNGGGTALFNFNGGTLKATATNSGATFMTSANMDAVTVYSGGGTIDNNSTNITIGNVLGAATGNGVTSIAVTDGGSGYIGAPLVKFTDGTGNTATGYAVMVDDGTGNGTYKVSSIVITSPGTYSVNPTTVTLTGGGATTAATIGTITTGANTSGGMTFTGSGTTTLSGANTYSGTTTISAGTVALSGSGTYGTGTLTVSGGTADLGTKSITNTLGALTGGGAVNNGTITNNSGTYDVRSGTVGAVLAGSNGLTKTTGGTVTLNGNNTYTGATTISAGTLSLGNSGSVASSSSIIVGSGAAFDVSGLSYILGPATPQTLRGAGTVTGAVSVGEGSTVAAGVNASTIGTLSFSSTLTGTIDSVFSLKLDSTAGTFDLLTASGAVTLGSATLSLLDIGSGAWTGTASPFSILHGSSIAGTFTGLADGSTVIVGSNSFTLNYTGTDVTLTAIAIPEPGTCAAIAGALVLGAVAIRRRRLQA